MNNTLKYGLAAAAVVVVALIGYQVLWGSPAPGGPGPSGSAEPSESASSSALAPGEVAPGPFVLLESADFTITVTISAPRWFGEPNNGNVVKEDNGNPPDGAGLIVFTGPLYVYGDPCHWSGTAPATPASTVDELVAALSAQALRDASDPVDITVGGYAGKSITLHVPDDAVFADCDEDTFGSWTTPGFVAPERYSQGPGQIEELYIVDVDGVLVVIDAMYFPGTPADVVDEDRAIAESATFAWP